MKKLVLHILLFLGVSAAYAQNSVLSTGHWFKVAVDHNGVYKLSQDQFSKMGFDVNSMDPRKIRIFGFPSGMLPQPNSTPRPDDLVELSIVLEGESDGSFDRNDFALFYGEGPNTQQFKPGKNVFFLQTNLYADKNFYFITVGLDNGKRIESRQAGSGGSSVTSFHDFAFHETNQVNILRSGREWFGENFELDPEQSFDLHLPGILPGSQVKVVSEVMAQSYNPSSFVVSFNGESIVEQVVAVIPDSQYSAKGRIKRDTVLVSGNLARPDQQSLQYNFNAATSRKSTGFLNFFSVQVERALSLTADQLIFRNGNTLNSTSRYSVAQVSTSERIWNIASPLSPVAQEFTLENGSASFSTPASLTLDEFIVFKTTIPSPELIANVPNQNLHGMNVPNMVIVTHPEFLSQAQRLADHRKSHNGLSVEVVTVDQVYNEFSSGKQDVSAIRDFMRWLYRKNSSAIQALLLVGKGSYDYKQRLQNNINLVPTYESRNSLLPLETYSSDDYFGFLEESEGEWIESSIEVHTLEIGVGRLPVKSLSEAQYVVDKLIRYDQDKNRFGNWRKNIVFVADDGSNSDSFSSVHQTQSNSMAEEIELENIEFNTRKIFLGSYTKKVSPNGETIPKANIDIREEFSDAVIINYTGHGSEKLWADERVLTPDDIASLKNKTYPFLVTATCEFGRQDDPLEVSSAEHSLLHAAGGCIGLVTTARPVNSSTNFELNRAFYDALFARESGQWLSVGEIFRRTKNNSASGVSNRNFSLIGDPGMDLALPENQVIVDEIKTHALSDTLKALSTVIVKGRIQSSDGEPGDDFTGTVEVTLFDKRTDFQTIGKNDPVFKYTQWFNPLFRGQGSITDGEFELSFILPKNIAYEINPGKLSLYAFNATDGRDATGGTSAFKIGGSESTPPTDDKSPEIRVFMGDSTFVDGGTVSPNTLLVVRLKDESGINISNYGIGNTMMAILDNGAETYLINESYLADRDDFTRGWVHYPIYDLSPGTHSLTVKAWDTHNNPAEGRILFEVSPENSLLIEDAGNYPNPFREETTIFFTHNRPGDDLEVRLSIVSATGMEIKTFHLNVPESPYRVELPSFAANADLTKKLAPGLYFARLHVRSVRDGAESMRVTKLIMAN